MTLIKSISGIRGTVGGKPGDNLTPTDALKFAAGFGRLLIRRSGKPHPVVVLGRDARPSGPMIALAVVAGLTGTGVHVIDLGLSTTPSVEMAVTGLRADGGIILTASHNPVQWNALKLLDGRGEFISAALGRELLELAESENIDYAPVDGLGTYRAHAGGYIDEHIRAILALDTVNVEAIRRRGFRVAIDAVNSTGGIAVPKLLDALGVEYHCLYCLPDGRFPHNPEPLEKHLADLMHAVPALGDDLGIAVDPDVDRLALVDEQGRMFGEEYTLVAVADYILQKTPGPTVSNLSSSRALRDITRKYGQSYAASAVGEVNVVARMKETGAVIGGEGNGGVIYPALHYGRDALVGIALLLSYLAESGKTLSELKKSYPRYAMAKEKLRLEGIEPEKMLEKFARIHAGASIDTTDGVKVDYPDHWIHLRRSNTEPIVRIYVEAPTAEQARSIALQTIEILQNPD